jgi:hypothetical protein
MSQVTLGGERLGAGKEQKINLKNYERSTHDLSYVWRSTMASGTLVPFMSEVGLPGDSFDINLNADIKTHPTIGPLFGSYKVQLDIFACPVRLYNGKLHMNLLNIGLDMSKIKLPQLILEANGRKLGDNDQINPSSLFSYLNIRGLGRSLPGEDETIQRTFNAIPYLAYWDIYKNYYANKQEEYGTYIHNPMGAVINRIDSMKLYNPELETITIEKYIGISSPGVEIVFGSGASMVIQFNNEKEPDPTAVLLKIPDNGKTRNVRITEIFNKIVWNQTQRTLTCVYPNTTWIDISIETRGYAYSGATLESSERQQISTFQLKNIDDMREFILSQVTTNDPIYINENTPAPYGPPCGQGDQGWSKESTQEGLALKTYQSDLFNNWISTEWIDGENGINAITAVNTTEGNFTIDSLQLARKVYDMLNRIAISGGTYDDWLDAVYTHQRTRSQENPMYMGGLIKELGFQEVVSNAGQNNDGTGGENQPLGTLAGRGTLTKKHKGGQINIKVDEPCYIMGIVSLTPRIDYSQGNKWDVNLKTLNDFHKPGLDEIGFQDLITDQMAWFDTTVSLGVPTFKSAGKQPAWINYMTNVNQTRGNFAEKNQQMFMTLNRRYEQDGYGNIKDLTTYIDPSKFNNIFADTRLDAQNFWTQIGVNITARRKMSARVMPNL